MMVKEAIRSIFRSARDLPWVRDLPVVRRYRWHAYSRWFALGTNINLNRGVFSSFEAAAASAPSTKPTGYNNDASANLYAEQIEPFLKDYPAALWLERAFNDGARSVFDLGGHFGVKYYALERLVQYPENLRWTVCDVPAVTRRGLEIASERDSLGYLGFTNDYEAMSGHDVLYASGSIQYLPVPLAEILSTIKLLPSHLIVNTAAIHPQKSFYTLNNIGTAFCPYRVMRERDFISSLEALGYRLRDSWDTPKDFIIPFEEGYNLTCFRGFCFELDVLIRQQT